MAIDLERLLLSVEANLKQYEKEMARANSITVREMRKAERAAQASALSIERQLASVGANVKAFLGGALAGAAAAFTVAIKNTISDAAKIGDVADKIGTTTKFLQELTYGAVQADLGFDELSENLTRFSRLLGEAQKGQGDLLALFEANGYSKAAVQALDFAGALRVVADLTKNAKNEQDQLQVTSAAFGGRAGGAMLEFLRTGAKGFSDFGDAAEKAGAILDDQYIRKAQDIDDRWAALMESLKKNTQSAVFFIIDQFSKIPTSTGAFAADQVAARRQGAASRSSINPPRVSGPGSAGGPNEFRAPPVVSKPVQTVVPDEDAIRRQKEKEAEERRLAAERERQRQAELKAIEDVIKALEFENEQLGRNELAQKIAAEQRQAGVSATSEQGKAIAALVTENYNLAQAQEYQKESQAAQLDAAKEATESFIEQQEAMREAWMQLAEVGVNALEDIIFNGAKAKDVVRDLAKSLASAALQGALLGKGPFGTLFGTSKGGGLFGSLFGGVSAGIYHAGGRVGLGGPSRMLPAAMFAGAPRYHSGTMGAGLKAGEVPAVLQQGEVVLPKNMKLGGGQSVAVTFAPVIDARNADAPAIDRLQQQLGKLTRDFEKNVKAIVSGEKSRQPRFLEI